jgi:hypothetical protein
MTETRSGPTYRPNRERLRRAVSVDEGALAYWINVQDVCRPRVGSNTFRILVLSIWWARQQMKISLCLGHQRRMQTHRITFGKPWAISGAKRARNNSFVAFFRACTSVPWGNVRKLVRLQVVPTSFPRFLAIKRRYRGPFAVTCFRILINFLGSLIYFGPDINIHWC